MDNYKNIMDIQTLDDGSMSIALKNGKEAIIEIVKFEEKFSAAIYCMFIPKFEQNKKKKNLLAELQKHDAYKECAREAIGWIDENQDKFVRIEEKEEF